MRLAPSTSISAPILAMAFVLGSPAAAQAPAATTAQPAAPAAAPVRDPAAIAALEQMGAYLRTLTTFQVAGDVTTEEVLDTGQSIEYTGAIDLVAQRPNRLRASINSSRKRREYYYDGQTLTVYAPRQGYYASVAALPTIDETLDRAAERLDLVIPLHDMFELGLNAELTSRITSGFLVGTEAVGDQVCTHYAFRQPDVDWEIWIREGEQMLPCKYRITSLEDEARPDYTVMLNWNLTPTIGPNLFSFVPPEGAERIPIAPATATASAQ